MTSVIWDDAWPRPACSLMRDDGQGSFDTRILKKKVLHCSFALRTLSHSLPPIISFLINSETLYLLASSKDRLSMQLLEHGNFVFGLAKRGFGLLSSVRADWFV